MKYGLYAYSMACGIRAIPHLVEVFDNYKTVKRIITKMNNLPFCKLYFYCNRVS